jgi:hypothetical protein
VARWKTAAHETDAMARMNDIINKQMQPQVQQLNGTPSASSPPADPKAAA